MFYILWWRSDMKQNKKANETPKSTQYVLEIVFIWETIRLPDREYLRVRVRKVLEKHCNF